MAHNYFNVACAQHDHQSYLVFQNLQLFQIQIVWERPVQILQVFAALRVLRLNSSEEEMGLGQAVHHWVLQETRIRLNS